MSTATQATALATPQGLVLSGAWTARALTGLPQQLAALPHGAIQADASGIEALDSAGAWLLLQLQQRRHAQGAPLTLRGLRPELAPLLQALVEQVPPPAAPAPPREGTLTRLGRASMQTLVQAHAMLGFVGETAQALASVARRPALLRWRPILFNLRGAGVDALPIVGLLSFLLGVVVAYQGANQLRLYGANIFVVDLVGLSMLRKFAPLITAIILAGRSGSAYAAQIGTMAVTDEIDALRTLGISPQQMLVLPKLVALVLAMPLLTVYADALGLAGGLLMAATQLEVGAADFIERLAKAVSVTDYLIGVGKAPVFAAIIVVVGCFQGFRTQGGADAVGRQTTRSVVQAIFLVIVADALFSVAFSALRL
jgi:phospholipid/cholesterol/gamma-HCH transport system permease protein